jgi:hypothetical protein
MSGNACVRPPVAVLACMLMVAGTACRRQADSQPLPLSTGAVEEIELDYHLEVESPKGFIQAREDDVFRTGDGFRIVLRTDFTAHFYLLDRSAGDTNYRIFAAGENGRPAVILRNTKTTLPSTAGTCFRLDGRSGDEELVIVASTSAVPDLAETRVLSRDAADHALAALQRCCQPPSLRRFVDSDWVKLIAGGRKDMVIAVRLPLRHEDGRRQ